MNQTARNRWRGGGLWPLAAAMVMLLLTACSLGPASIRDPARGGPATIPQEVAEESRNLRRLQEQYRQALENLRKKAAEAEPVMPKYDPLEHKIVSFSMVDEDMRTVLFVLAQAVGMNLIIDPNIKAEDSLITLHFERVPASKVLHHVLRTFDLSYEIDGNVLAIRPLTEKIFTLNFLDANLNTSFDVGGDVFGATGDEEGVSGLSGTFRMTGEGAKAGNPYDIVESMIRPLLSPQGKFALNRLAGTLYVKDTPGNLEAVETLINNFKEMAGRQIQIDAQIIEVTLSDQHQYGINWDMLKSDTSGDELTAASWSLGGGLILNGALNDFSLSSTIDALNMFGDTKVVSNPTIRCKHGIPAIISVGTSYTYKKSVKTTVTGSGDTARDTTEVDVSTVFDGLILGVVPFIERNQLITLMINPIKSEVDAASLEPESVGDSSGDSISLPEINVKEINTTIALHSGDAVILGGLIDRRRVVDNRGIPFLSAIPIIGYLFKNEYEREETRELVLVLSVRLV